MNFFYKVTRAISFLKSAKVLNAKPRTVKLGMRKYLKIVKDD